MYLSSTSQREGNNLSGLSGFRLENGSSQGQKLALSGKFVLFLLDSGGAGRHREHVVADHGIVSAVWSRLSIT